MSKIGAVNIEIGDGNDETRHQKLVESLEAASTALNGKTIDSVKKTPQKPSMTVIERFAHFVNTYGVYADMGGRKYLRAEAWQYLAYLLRLNPVVVCTPVFTEVDGKERLVGVRAICELRNAEGKTLGSGTMVAKRKEKFLQGKPEYATYGMAQTRAVSRAVRNSYSWVAAAAGFEVVPYEEIA